MNNCGTCKHWGSVCSTRFRGDLKCGDQKRCGRIADASDVGESELINETAYTEDGEDYYSALLTKPDFGCVLWEAKQ